MSHCALLFFVFEIGSYYVAQADLKSIIFLPQPLGVLGLLPDSVYPFIHSLSLSLSLSLYFIYLFIYFDCGLNSGSHTC
jgi:hypothetical protein